MVWLLGRLVAQTAHSVALQIDRAPFLSSIISLHSIFLRQRETCMPERRNITFSWKLRRGSWERVGLDLGLGIRLALSLCFPLAISLPELSVDLVIQQVGFLFVLV